MLPIIVPTLDGDSVASRVLRCEGLEVTDVWIGGDRDYASALGYWWRRGDGFILVEDDMAPWPGAIAELDACDSEWCAFDYSIGFGRMGGIDGLGCVKFGPDLLARRPDLWHRWEGVHWRQLDHAVHSAIKTATNAAGPHVHTPAIAHAKHYRGAT